MKATKVVLVGLLAGITAGALLGVVLTSGKRSDLRRKIMDKGEDLADGIKDSFSEGAEGIKNKADKYHRKAETEFAKGKEKHEEFKQGTEPSRM